MLKHLLLLIVLAISQHVLTQNWTNTKNIWQKLNADFNFEKKQKLNTNSENFLLYRLDILALRKKLTDAPLWSLTHSITKKNNHTFTILQMPLPDGSMQLFHVMESPVMHPILANKFPQIKSYKGQGISDASSILYFDISDRGLHGAIFSGNNKPVFIDPISPDKDNQYKIYYKNDLQKSNEWDCHVPEKELKGGKTKNNTFHKSGFCGLRTFRIAIACTGEYAQYHGGTKELALAAMHTTITRLNGIFERDLSIFLQMVPNNDLLVFLNPYSDPFTNSVGWDMLGKNQSICDEIIGENNYDIGHVFSTNGGGLAQIRSVCKPGLKAQGATGYSVPEGDAFDIDYVAHEMGHQFGANHTQNNNCNRHTPTAVEPGSGSSIMSYAGLCFPNIQSTSDTYFHALNIREINDCLNNDDELCSGIYSQGNSLMADAGKDYIIPKSTPFKLNGTVLSDIPKERILCNWEQADNQISVMPPSGQNKFGPLFRTYPPTSDPFRFFPKLPSLIRNEPSQWEVLPDSERDMNFIFSARGNQVEGSCNDMDEIKIKVAGNSGPFKIISPLDVHWIGGTQKEVSWDIAGTADAPINCSHVDILLSEDGGYNYSIELALNVPNDGSHNIIVPNIQTEEARIMVKAVDNIFFDITDHHLIIDPATDFWVSLNVTDLNCKDDLSGSISARPFGGNGEYDYLWSNGETGNTINGLASGNYTVTVTSDNIIAIANAVVHDPFPIQIDFILNTDDHSSNNVLTAFPSGGTGKYDYRWDNGSSGNTIKITSPGNYSLTITDSNGCIFSERFQVSKADLNKDKESTGFPLANKTDALKYVNLYPNPNAGLMHVEFFQKNQGGPELIVFDMVGREVRRMILLQRKEGWRSEFIDLSELNKGCYILQLIENDIRKIQKFVKF